jgi:hypothetical protein
MIDCCYVNPTKINGTEFKTVLTTSFPIYCSPRDSGALPNSSDITSNHSTMVILVNCWFTVISHYIMCSYVYQPASPCQISHMLTIKNIEFNWEDRKAKAKCHKHILRMTTPSLPKPLKHWRTHSWMARCRKQGNGPLRRDFKEMD